MSIIKLEKYKIIFKDKNNYINFIKYSENIKSIKNISRNEKSICRTTLQNIRWEGTQCGQPSVNLRKSIHKSEKHVRKILGGTRLGP